MRRHCQHCLSTYDDESLSFRIMEELSDGQMSAAHITRALDKSRQQTRFALDSLRRRGFIRLTPDNTWEKVPEQGSMTVKQMVDIVNQMRGAGESELDIRMRLEIQSGNSDQIDSVLEVMAPRPEP